MPERLAATRIGAHVLAEVDSRLATADGELASRFPGDSGSRQPVHTVYVPGDRVHADLIPEWSAAACAALDEHAPDAPVLAAAVGLDESLVEGVLPRVKSKLESEPVEDLRIDFEDGFGRRSDAVEDAAVVDAARIAATIATPFIGIRFKSFEPATRRRGIRTLDLFLGELHAAGGPLGGLVVTMPKVTSVAQVEAMVLVCERLEQAYHFPVGRLRFEVQVETPQAVLGPDGTALVARMVHAARGRISGLHYGTYDFSAAAGISAGFQSLEHPIADHAKEVMQLAAADTGVRVSDGSTNVLPVGSRAQVHAAWALHARLVRRSLERGFYQGWDLHPAQLVTRYLATYAFFRAGLPAAAARLRAYVQRADSDILDEPATARALAWFIVRGLDCGALDDAEVADATGLDRVALAMYARSGRSSS